MTTSSSSTRDIPLSYMATTRDIPPDLVFRQTTPRGVFPWCFEKYTPEKYPRYKKRPHGPEKCVYFRFYSRFIRVVNPGW